MFFDAVRNNKRVVQIFLALITLPFAFWGVDSYVRNTGAGTDLARVGDSKITMQQFDQAWRTQQDRLRQVLGANFRPELMNTPAAKLAVLNSLIDQRLLLLEAAKGRLGAGDDLLARGDQQDSGLAGRRAVFADTLSSRTGVPGYVASPVRGTASPGSDAEADGRCDWRNWIAGNTVTNRLLRIQAEERQIAEWRLAPEQYAGQVKIDASAVQAYYEQNKVQFEVPEQAKVEYLVLSLDVLLAQLAPSDAEVSAWYEGHKDRYQQPEERRASHILILTGGDVDPEKARAKAAEALKEVQKSPARFAELAKQYSQDPGSAEKGGDLGFFARGTMVKAFDESVFKLRENEISDLVQSEFGYHIIKLTAIKAGKQRSLVEVRPEIEDELKRQTAARQFADAAESFSNMVYEQPDSLQPAADRFKLKIQQSGWVARNTAPELLATLGQLGNQKILSALFADDSVKNKRNTEVVEIAPNTLLAARVLEHRPASTKPLEAVRAGIEATLKAQEEAKLARAAGEARLRELQQGGEDKVTWSLVRNVSRQDGRQVPGAALKAIFKADVEKLPAYVGAQGSDGNYLLYKIMKVSHPEKVDENSRKALQREYATIVGQEDFSAYLSGLRTRYKIDINKPALESKDR
jgi:peptidyl-prolyl cis-trans isomerase D